MKKVRLERGGRPFANDDLKTLQQELTDAVQAQFLGKGPFILTGCEVSGPANAATVTAGIVCLDGELLRFEGASAVALPAQFQAGSVVLSDPRPYQTGGTKNCAEEKPAVLVASDPTYTGGEFLPIDTWGGKTWQHVQRAAVRSLHEVQFVAVATLANYDSTTGLGLPGSEAWGWLLSTVNDPATKRVSMAGRVPLGMDPNRPDYDSPNKYGGSEKVSLTADQNGPHNHAPDGQFDYNRLLRLANFGENTTADGTNGSGNGNGGEPDIVTTGAIQQSGSGAPHENRMPYTTLLARQWVGY